MRPISQWFFQYNPTNITLFYTIIYQEVQLIVKKCPYPDTNFENFALLFYHWLQEVDRALKGTHEFDDSFIQPINNLVLALVLASN